jgi:hypothetical protein
MSLRPEGEDGRFSTASSFISTFYDDSESHFSKDEDVALSTARTRGRNSNTSPRSSASGSVLAAETGLKQRRLSAGQTRDTLDVRSDLASTSALGHRRQPSSVDLGHRWPMSPDLPPPASPQSQERYESLAVTSAGPPSSRSSLVSPNSISPAAEEDAFVFPARKDSRAAPVGQVHPLALNRSNASSDDVVDESDDAPLKSNMAFVSQASQNIDPHSFPPRLGRRRGSSAANRRSIIVSAKRSIRRLSTRVASMAAGSSEGNHFRLPEADEDGITDTNNMPTKEQPDKRDSSAIPNTVLRGKSLGLFGPRNAFRLACRQWLLWP